MCPRSTGRDSRGPRVAVPRQPPTTCRTRRTSLAERGGWMWTFHSLRHVFATWAINQPSLRVEDVLTSSRPQQHPSHPRHLHPRPRRPLRPVLRRDRLTRTCPLSSAPCNGTSRAPHRASSARVMRHLAEGANPRPWALPSRLAVVVLAHLSDSRVAHRAVVMSGPLGIQLFLQREECPLPLEPPELVYAPVNQRQPRPGDEVPHRARDEDLARLGC